LSLRRCHDSRINPALPPSQTTHRRSWSRYYCFLKLQFWLLVLFVLDFEFFSQQYSCSSNFAAAEVTTESSYERKMDD
jgi:hypothetical protein